MIHKQSDRLIRFPYWVQLTETHIREEHVAWLKQNMPNGYPGRWTFGGPYRLYFADENDKLMFVLRWA